MRYLADAGNAFVFVLCVCGAAWFALAIIDRVRGT